MARRPSATLTDTEVRVMQVLWDRGQVSVAEIVAALTGSPVLAYNTVQTILRILEHKGQVDHEKSGRAFRYRALVDRHTARRRALGHLLKRLFDGSPSLLVLNVLEDEDLDARELERVKRLIQGA